MPTTVTAAPETTVVVQKVRLTGLGNMQPVSTLSGGGLPALQAKLNALITAHNELLAALK